VIAPAILRAFVCRLCQLTRPEATDTEKSAGTRVHLVHQFPLIPIENHVAMVLGEALVRVGPDIDIDGPEF
jgi:hypothetical protein